MAARHTVIMFPSSRAYAAFVAAALASLRAAWLLPSSRGILSDGLDVATCFRRALRHAASGGSSESFPPCRDMSPSIVLEPKRWRPAMYSVFTLHFCRMVVSCPSLVQLEGSGFDRAVMTTTRLVILGLASLLTDEVATAGLGA